MKNFKLVVSYDGTRYFGWEHQPDTEMTIQGKLESVLNQMLELPEGESVTVIGAGRTDAGVHARAMTCNVLLDTARTEEEVMAYMNRYLPDDISVNSVKLAADRFHSRFKAIGKTYRYTCWYGGSKPVFDRRYVTVLDKKPDIARMKKPTVRVVDVIRIEESGNYIRFYYHGNGFLQNMVRIMTGTLLEVGWGRREAADMSAIIEGRDRKLAGFTAPAQGLCLMKVDY